MSMRGVEKPGSVTATTCFLGEFETNRDKRQEFLIQLQGGHSRPSIV